MTTSAILSLAYVAVYVLLVGVASFIEKPAGRGFGAFQLNALIRVGSLAAAAVALVFAHGPAFPAAGYLFAGLGIGLLTGVGSMLYCFGLNYTSIAFTERLAAAGAQPSVGTVDNAYNNALAESVIGLYKTELIKPRGPWRTPEQVEIA